jgi:hypothetical protein
VRRASRDIFAVTNETVSGMLSINPNWLDEKLPHKSGKIIE